MSYHDFDEDDEMSEEEDNMDDDTLTPLERLAKYKTSPLLLQRLRIVKEISDIALQIGYEETKEKLIQPLQDFADDKEGAVLQALAEQLSFFATFFREHGGSDGETLILSTLLPIVHLLLTDEHHQVRGTAAESFVGIASNLSEEQQNDKVLPIITKLSKNSAEEDHRIEAAELLNKLAPVFKGDILSVFCVEKITQLSKDTMFRVRKAIASAIGISSGLVSEDIVTNKLLPVFLRLTSDDIWGVRKACAESIVSVSQHSSRTARLQQLTPVYLNLIKDASRWVRNSTYQHLGPFIATLDGNEVPQQLLEHYTGMIEGTRSQYGDSDTVRFCAFSFPGVLLTLGRDKWTCLQKVYSTLTEDLQWKVRRTLSHSLHEVAIILGTELTEAHLLSTFGLFLKDLDQVKVGVIRHLSEFLEILSPERRKDYVDIITDIQLHGGNWRFRKLLAKQLGKLASLFDISTVTTSIIPMAIQLCEDQVTTVRYAVTKELGLFLSHLNSVDEGVASDFIETILPFSTRSSCYDRQTFAMICENLVGHISPAVFEAKFFPPLVELSKDKVPNVRFIVARVIVGQLYKNDDFSALQAEIQRIKDILKSDDDREVRYYARPDNC
eukprot:CAMPEP_0117008902 /NCGR_PEP_ID=MMETSP0472-20121206/8245_1 /TAXON_ID=693140 ORGANISM="Tiarina fusus, Strain LIS" /NCGR_SAMPLE_ID=MMETSP0472 /ASSEMBLY_ACC=CAM_ASM_000603 /LENGTH=610 /DNA_ID=CAMNT_0004711061 /DNA_START=14 /DNA_END=1846 /DNA_ORIENTATION=+